MVRVSAGARLHFGFGNLSLAHERLYGALGVALDEPRAVVSAAPADGIEVEVEAGGERAEPRGAVGERERPWPDAIRERARDHAARAAELLDVPGAEVTVERSLPHHVGLGSGTQLALTVLAAVAGAYDRPPQVRERAPALGRGGRSGVGVAAFESGGFVLDAGHPTARFTTDRPADGEWAVPTTVARHGIPDDWRFLLVLPSVDPGRSGDEEDASMRSVVEGADPAVADRIAGVLTRRLLPAIAEGSAERFGAAVSEVGRLNGTWYADEQGGVYRPPVGELVDRLSESPAVYGAGQSSWGPAVYGVTDADRADRARRAGEAALDAAGVSGTVRVVRGRNRGATFERGDGDRDGDGIEIGTGEDPAGRGRRNR